MKVRLSSMRKSRTEEKPQQKISKSQDSARWASNVAKWRVSAGMPPRKRPLHVVRPMARWPLGRTLTPIQTLTVSNQPLPLGGFERKMAQRCAAWFFLLSDEFGRGG